MYVGYTVASSPGHSWPGDEARYTVDREIFIVKKFNLVTAQQ